MAYDFGHDIERINGYEVVQINLRTKYRPGGLQAARVFGLLAMQALLPFLLFFWRLYALARRQKVVQLVSTLPPLLHLAGLIWGSLLRVPTIVWYQDAHPEIETRILESRGHRLVPDLLRWLDRNLLSRAHCIVALDQAMLRLIRDLGVSAKLVEAQPWVTYAKPAKPLRAPRDEGALRLFYAGNYGFAHDLTPLVDLLRSQQLTELTRIEITAMGMNEDARRRFEDLFVSSKIALRTLPRVDAVEDVYRMMEEFDLGIVSLRDTYAGIACPSKALTYVSQGLAILYVGPAGTLPFELCMSGWGVTLEQLRASFANQKQPMEALTQYLARIGHILPDPRGAAFETLKAEIDHASRS